MSFKRLVVKPTESITQWEELFLTNLLSLQNYSLQYLFSGEISKEDMMKLGVLLHNLGRVSSSYRQFLAVYKVSDITAQISFLNGLGKIFMADHQEVAALAFYNTAVSLLSSMTNCNSNLLSDCIARRDEIQKKHSEPKYASEEDDIKIIDNKIMKSDLLFTNYEYFENRMFIFKFILESISAEQMSNYKFVNEIVTSWNVYNLKSSILLSGLVTKSTEDLENSLDAIFSFISKFPVPMLLITKFLSFSSIKYIIDETLSKFEDAQFGNEITMEDLIIKSEIFNKEHNYFKYLSVYLQTKLILNVKLLILEKEKNPFIIYNFELITNMCHLIIELLKPEIDIHILPKKLIEKRKKLLLCYKDGIEQFQNEILKIGIVSIIYTFLAYKDDPDLTTFNYEKSKNDLKLKMFKKSTFLMKTFYILIKSQNVDIGDENIIKKIIIFSDEILAFLIPQEISLESLDKPPTKFRTSNKYFTERLISGYIGLLENNSIDNPINVKLISHILYCVLLQGGYHISVIWFLSIIREVSKLKSSLSLISMEDGEDKICSIMFGETINKYKDELEIIINRINDAQESIETLELSSSQTQDDTSVFTCIKQKYKHRNGHELILPQVIIDLNDDLIFLPEFCNFIQNGSTIRINLMKSGDHESRSYRITDNCGSKTVESKFENKIYSGLKSILRPTIESIYECIKKSDVLIENILNERRIGIVDEIKKSHRARFLIDEACGDRVVIHASEEAISEEYADLAERMKRYSFQENIIKKHELDERIQLFRKQHPISAETDADLNMRINNRNNLWNIIRQNGVTENIIELVL